MKTVVVRKSVGFGRGGSSPPERTTINFNFGVEMSKAFDIMITIHNGKISVKSVKDMKKKHVKATK